MSVTYVAVQLAALAAVLLHLIASLLPESAAWSVWPYTVLPLPLAWLGGLGVASLVLTRVNDALGRLLNRLETILSKYLPASEAGTDRRLWFAGVAVGTAIPFWFFRIRHLRWGDAQFIVKSLSYTGLDRPVWTIFNWQSPLSIYIHAQLWFLLNPIPGVGVDTLYAVTSVLSGVGFVYVLFLLADSLGRDRTQKVTIFGLVIATGSMQLFFGYVENYTVISLGLILTLYLCVRCLRGQTSLVWPSLALAVTNAFHPSTVVLWPAVAYLAWRVAGWQPSKARKVRVWAKVILPPLLIFAGLSALMMAGGHGPDAMLANDRPGGADGIPFVPLFQVTTEWQHYTLFSIAHLLDWSNEHFLISPFGLFLLLLAFAHRISRRRSLEPPQDNSRLHHDLRYPRGDAGIAPYLIIASVAYLVLTFVWNPDYGGRRDWDLFAPSAFVYTSLAAYLLARQLGDGHDSRQGRTILARANRLLIAVSALHTIAWVYYNTIPWPYDGG